MLGPSITIPNCREFAIRGCVIIGCTNRQTMKIKYDVKETKLRRVKSVINGHTDTENEDKYSKTNQFHLVLLKSSIANK